MKQLKYFPGMENGNLFCNVSSFFLSLWVDEFKKGQIQFTGFYKNNSSQDSAITENLFVVYSVNSKDGIYENVSKIILNAIFNERILYFIGK